MKKYLPLIISILIILGIFATNLLACKAFNNSCIEEKLIFTYSYIPHEPISINGDMELAEVSNSGSGNPKDPFMIEGWNITGTQHRALSIKNTSMHFIVQNCWIKGSGYNSGSIAINIFNCSQGTVKVMNNSWRNAEYGLSLEYCRSAVIKNNFSNHTQLEMLIRNSEESVIENNILSIGTEGIVLANSSSSIIENNYCTDLAWGISVYESSNTSIQNNICVNIRVVGILLNNSASSAIINNSMRVPWNGLQISYSSKSLISNNYFKGNRWGISVFHSSFLRICENNFSGTIRGIKMTSADSGTISSNFFLNNDQCIILDSSMWCSMTSNVLRGNKQVYILKDSITMGQMGAFLFSIGVSILVLIAIYSYKKYQESNCPLIAIKLYKFDLLDNRMLVEIL